MVMGELKMETDLLIIGAGAGGYSAAFRAASLGMEVTIVDERKNPGGACLNEGCIPSKTLVHATSLADEVKRAERFGLIAENLSIDHEQLRKHKDEVIDGLTQGLRNKLVRAGINLVKGRARFVSDKEVAVKGADVSAISFRKAIIATGSRFRRMPGAPAGNLWYSAHALRLQEVPKRLIVIGGGYIGMEMGSVYASLGSEVTVIEALPEIMGIADRDLVSVMLKSASSKFKEIITNCFVKEIVKNEDSFSVRICKDRVIEADKVFVSIGRMPNTGNLDIEHTGVTVNERGFIEVDDTGRTNVPHIFAIGDCVPGPALAHKASREGKIAAEVLSGLPSAFDNRGIPAVVFTDPEIAWVGLTEQEAQLLKQKVSVGRYPLKALGRAHAVGRTDGLVKVISDPDTGLLLGVGIVSSNASDLIAEATLAIEMGATLEDLKATLHPHPTFSEAIQEAAELASATEVRQA